MKISEYLNQLETQRVACSFTDTWVQAKPDSYRLPAGSGLEQRALNDISRTPWLGLVIDTEVQGLKIERITRADGGGDEPILRTIWQKNDLQRLQPSIYRAVLSYGSAFGVVTPTAAGEARVRVLSPRRMVAEFAEPTDRYPVSAFEDLGDNRACIYSAESYTYLRKPKNSTEWVVDSTVAHDLGVCPVVRFTNKLSLDGEVTSEIEPFVPLARRIHKATQDLESAAHFSAHRLLWITGATIPRRAPQGATSEPGALFDQAVDLPLTEEDVARASAKIGPNTTYMTENPDSKLGAVEGAQLTPFVEVLTNAIETLASVTQTPVYALTGQLVNLSADAISASRGPLLQKIAERQESLGASIAHLLRLAAAIEGFDEVASDETVRVTWRDVEIRSLAQFGDYVVKLVSAGVPIEALLEVIPIGVEPSDVDLIKRAILEKAARDPLAQALHDAPNLLDDDGAESDG